MSCSLLVKLMNGVGSSRGLKTGKQARVARVDPTRWEERGAVRKDREANVVLTNHYMHDDEVVGTRVGGLGKNGFLERRGVLQIKTRRLDQVRQEIRNGLG